MARPRYDDPCPCGSGRRYRDCHRRLDRQQGQVTEPQSPTPPQGSAAPTPAPPSAVMRIGPWVVGVLGLALAGWIASTRGPQAALAVCLATGLCVAGFFVFGDPPPPKDDPGDPAGINFGR